MYETVPKLKEALQNLVNQFDVSPSGTHVSFETFHYRSTLHNKFNDDNYHSNKAIDDLITRSLNKLRQPTRLDIALKTGNEAMFTMQSGQRPGVQSAMILYTDGRSHPRTEDFFPDIAALKVSSTLSGFQYFVNHKASLKKIYYQFNYFAFALCHCYYFFFISFKQQQQQLYSLV